MASERPVVVVADAIAPAALEELRAEPVEVVDVSAEPARLREALGAAWALVLRSRTRVDAALIDAAPKLRIIGRAGVGVDNIEVPAATAKGIRVVNAPGAAAVSVAELTLALYLLLLRDLYAQIQRTKSGEWKRGENRAELAGKTVGFVGYGRIAREVAARLRPFSARTIAYDPYVHATDDGTRLVGLEELLGQADIVSLHAALTADNRGLLNAERLGRMKRGAFLVNVARGGLVETAALREALESGHLGGAALDVFEIEPPADARLLSHPRLIPTPHIGASTHEGQERAGLAVVAELRRALQGKPLTACVNPEPAP